LRVAMASLASSFMPATMAVLLVSFL